MQKLYNQRLTRKDIIELAKEDKDFLLGHSHGGLYDANTDQVRFAFNKKKMKTRATLACLNPVTDEYEEIKVEYHTDDNKHKYNVDVHKAILLHKMFNLDVPEMYLEIPEPDETQAQF